MTMRHHHKPNVVSALAVGAMLIASCADEHGVGASRRSFYESEVLLSSDELKGLVDACLVTDGEPSPDPLPWLRVRSLTGDGQSGVDLRVEVSQYVSFSRADCVDKYLDSLGAEPIDASSSGADGGGGSGSGDDGPPDPSTTGGATLDPSTTGAGGTMDVSTTG